ncbi:MAG: hypothetical protein ACE5FB_01215 [Candidatus Binatia bacterium]
MDNQEFHEIKERAEEIKKLMEPYIQNWIEMDVRRIIAEFERLRDAQERLLSTMHSLKAECLALLADSEECLSEIEDSQPVIRNVLNDVNARFGSINLRELVGQLDRTLSVSAVDHSSGSQASDVDNKGIDSLQPSKGGPLNT